MRVIRHLAFVVALGYLPLYGNFPTSIRWFRLKNPPNQTILPITNLGVKYVVDIARSLWKASYLTLLE